MADQNSSGEGRREKNRSGEWMRWTLYRPNEDNPEIRGHVNAEVRVIGDDLPGRTEVAPVSELERVEADRERAESGHEFTKQWYAERIRKITDVAKREGIWEEVACILANGTSGPEEPPTYAQLLNMAKWGQRQAETRASALRDQLDEAASRQPELEDLASLLESDQTAAYNVAQDLKELADVLGALPQRAITEHDEIEALHDRIIELEAAVRSLLLRQEEEECAHAERELQETKHHLDEAGRVLGMAS